MTGPEGVVVEVRDHALWVRHVLGSADLVTWLEAVPSGAIVRLSVDGVAGDWRKMADGPDGRRTDGFNPITEPARSNWHALQARRGTKVTFALADE